MSETSQPKATIRPAVEADAEALRDLRLEALRNHPTFFGSDYETQQNEPAEYWLNMIRNHQGETGMIMVAAAGGQLVGMSGIRKETRVKSRHNSEIWGVYVRPGWRGQRLGDALVQACLDWARERGATQAILGVIVGNTPAILSYTRLGFVPYGVQPRHYRIDGQYYDMIEMAKKLD